MDLFMQQVTVQKILLANVPQRLFALYCRDFDQLAGWIQLLLTETTLSIAGY